MALVNDALCGDETDNGPWQDMRLVPLIVLGNTPDNLYPIINHPSPRVWTSSEGRGEERE